MSVELDVADAAAVDRAVVNLARRTLPELERTGGNH
jgi:hypothetical protein